MGRVAKGRRMYVEAFPSIDIVALERQVAKGNRFCQWTNEHLAEVGFIEILALTRGKLKFAHCFHGCPNIAPGGGTVSIRLERRDRGAHLDRPMMICPSCNERRQQLYYVFGHWECSICHNLCRVYNLYSRVMAKSTRDYLELKVLISFGRRKGQQHKTFDAMEEKARRLKYRKVGLTWQSEAFYTQVARWMPDDSAIIRAVNPEHWPYCEPAGSKYGFQRLVWFGLQEEYTERIEFRRKAYRSYQQSLREERAALRKRSIHVSLDPEAVAAGLGLGEFDGPDEHYD